MIIVTGGAGFIGSNIIKALNNLGREDIIVVDDLSDGKKFVNLAGCKIQDYIDKEDFIDDICAEIGNDFFQQVEVVFHQGACTDTTEWNGRYMLDENYQYSKILLHCCINSNVPFIYASSAAVYGGSSTFIPVPENEKPLNVYGFSKLLFDQYVRSVMAKVASQIVGLRYFNVYGPREQHKGEMASMVFHLHNQLQDSGELRLFSGYENYAAGEQRRDFIYVEDIAAVNLWFWQHKNKHGIFNLGTGKSHTFNELAEAVIAWHGKGKISYIPFPDKLKNCYQSFTQADISDLRKVGCKHEFKNIQQGVKLYLDWLRG